MFKKSKITKGQVVTEFNSMVEELGYLPTRTYFLSNNKLKGLYKTSFSSIFSSFNELVGLCGHIPVRRTPSKELVGIKCTQCLISIDRDIRDIKNNNFCSSSCSAIYHNKKRVYRKKGLQKTRSTCKSCGTGHERNSSYCSTKCRLEYNAKHRTLKECLTSGSNQQKFSNVRGMARSYVKHLEDKHSCQNCGYAKHIEIAHIKAISDFDLQTKLYEVNHKDNLLALCPNCHWEFDNDQLTLEEILK